MAAVQQQPRTRAARLAAAHSNRPLQVPKELQTNHQTSHLHHGAATTTASSVSLFLTNLRLLDLDLQPDWPGISADIFVSNAQGQKKRVQCVEWALFNLFALWDPEETTNKLKPFFPPLDQVQSLNLRAALLRSLEQAKKNGVLGRDAVLRKTMLDECKGERLEDLLASFSAAVLKKVIVDEASARGEHQSLALSMAVENRGYKGDKTELSCLVLAHKVSLRGVLKERNVNAAKFRDFSDLLGVKERGLARKREEANARAEKGDSQTVSDEARREMWRTIRNNWSGNERWMETLLHGGATVKKDGPFGMPFDRVWRRVQQSRLAEVESRDSGLLEQLDNRVKLHKDRLEKWQKYRTSTFGQPQANISSPSKRPAPTQSTKGVNFGFGEHESLALGAMSPRTAAAGSTSRMTSEYRDILTGLKKELAGADEMQSGTLDFLRNRKCRVNAQYSSAGSEVSDISELEDDSLDSSFGETPDQSFQDKVDSAKRHPIRPNLVRPDLGGFNYSNSGTLNLEPNSATDDSRSQRSSNPSTPRARSISRQSPNRPYLSQGDQTVVPSPTQEAADQILQSMSNTSPSPTKRPRPRHTLSLAERTRLSMAPRGTSLFLEEDEEEAKCESPTGISPNDTKEIDLEAEVEDDLISRTRKSMAGFEKARQKAQIERRRSLRKSRVPPQQHRESSFPKVEEDQEDGMLAEELMGEEDMEAVFRSRPKIQASPLPSPTKELDFEYGSDYN